MKKYLLLILAFYFSFSSNAQLIIKDYIYFDSDKFEINEPSKAKLDALIHSISNLEEPKILLTGHTDDQGDHDYNLSLSKNRVSEVSKYFKSRGLENIPIQLDFYGETIPLANNKTEIDRQTNRRVEISIIEFVEEGIISQKITEDLPNETIEPTIKKPEIKYVNPREVLTGFGSEAQVFCIQNDRDTVLQGVDGTILFIKAGSFKSNEITCDCIEIQLKEFYTPEQIILNNLNTQAGNRLLETQGAIKVEAFCNNKLLNLKRGEKIDLYFPNLNEDNDYQLFSGREDEYGVDWAKNTRNTSSQFLPDFRGQNGRGMSVRTSYCNYNFFLKRWFCKWKIKRGQIRRQRNLRAWLPDLEDRFGAVNFVGLSKKIDNKTLRIFTSSKMGYINCDRFLSYPQRQLVNVYIKEATKSESQKMMTSIVFKNINSVMSGVLDTKGRHWYLKVPKQKEVWIVAVKKEKGNYYLAIKDYVLDDKPIEDLVFEQVSAKELGKSLASIGW